MVCRVQGGLPEEVRIWLAGRGKVQHLRQEAQDAGQAEPEARPVGGTDGVPAGCSVEEVARGELRQAAEAEAGSL